MEKLKTFNQALECIKKTNRPFYIHDGKEIRYAEHFKSPCPCPLQAVAEDFGICDSSGVPHWSVTCEDYTIQEHIVVLADNPEYRKEHPEDAKLLLLACGLENDN